MSIFSRTAADYIVKIIALAKKAKENITDGEINSTKTLLRSILKFDIKQLEKIEEETGDKKLVEECTNLHSATEKALSSLENNELEKTKELLDKIITLESNDILIKVQKYHELKKELKQKKFDIDRIADALGKGIDGKIKPLVATFKYCGLRLDQSCEGHLDHGSPHPWIRIEHNYHVKELFRVVQEYNSTNKIKWVSHKLSNRSDFTSQVAVLESNRRELKKEELDFIAKYCKEEIEKNNFQIACYNMRNYYITILPKKGTYHEDLRKIFAIIKKPLTEKGFIVELDVPGEHPEPDTYMFEAEGGTLKEMQQDIIQFSDFILENFKVPKI